MVEETLGEYVFDPDKSSVPPVGALYQSMVAPALGVAERLTVPGPHRAALVPVGTACVLTVMEIALEMLVQVPEVTCLLYQVVTAGFTGV